jgi:hypothetical protein
LDREPNKEGIHDEKVEQIKPSLQLFSEAGKFRYALWKKFKNKYSVIRAIMNVLLDVL